MGDNTVGLGVDAHALANRSVFLQPRDLAFRDAQRCQSFPGCLAQHRVVAAQGREEFLLRVDERGGVQLEQ